MNSVRVANLALTRVGARSISSLTVPEETPEWNVVASCFQDVFDELMCMTPWQAATHRALITPLSEEPLFEWDYKYLLPQNPFCLEVISCHEEDGTEITEWIKEGEYLLANESSLYIKYIKRVTDASKLPMYLAKALSLLLSQTICIQLNPSTNLFQILNMEFERAFMKAVFRDKDSKGKSQDFTSWDTRISW
jgi:hypothetical protein